MIAVPLKLWNTTISTRIFVCFITAGIKKTLVLIRYLLTIALEHINILLEATDRNNFSKYDLEKIVWVKKSKYEKANEQDSHHYRALINDLESHGGTILKNGYRIWQFSTGNMIGRKPVKNWGN